MFPHFLLYKMTLNKEGGNNRYQAWSFWCCSCNCALIFSEEQFRNQLGIKIPRRVRKEQLSVGTRVSGESAKPLWEERFSNKICQGWSRIIFDLASTLWEGLDLLKSLLVSISMTPQSLISREIKIKLPKERYVTMQNIQGRVIPCQAGSLPGIFQQRTLL